MDTTEIKKLVKAKLGIGMSNKVRDTLLTAIIDGIIDELENEKGLVLNSASPNHKMFLVDYSVWRYQNRDSNTGMPRHLQYRLHNMFFNARRDHSDL